MPNVGHATRLGDAGSAPIKEEEVPSSQGVARDEYLFRLECDRMS